MFIVGFAQQYLISASNGPMRYIQFFFAIAIVVVIVVFAVESKRNSSH